MSERFMSKGGVLSAAVISFLFDFIADIHISMSHAHNNKKSRDFTDKCALILFLYQCNFFRLKLRCGFLIL